MSVQFSTSLCTRLNTSRLSRTLIIQYRQLGLPVCVAQSSRSMIAADEKDGQICQHSTYDRHR